ncbi:MAG TPA: hypothetical protein VKB43_07205 [Gaiellaceae bacterium]|nr:hypothetical protein [Gaiellaceae bacterium]
MGELTPRDLPARRRSGREFLFETIVGGAILVGIGGFLLFLAWAMESGFLWPS